MSHASYPRAARVREAIREVLAAEVERLKDPRVGFVTITDVTVSADLRHAKAFYTVYGSEEERAATREGLRRATGHLRGAVAHQVRLRFAPTLELVEDPLPDRTRRVEGILARLDQARRREEPGAAAGDEGR
jgi:ribosome-binding factor A